MRNVLRRGERREIWCMNLEPSGTEASRRGCAMCSRRAPHGRSLGKPRIRPGCRGARGSDTQYWEVAAVGRLKIGTPQSRYGLCALQSTQQDSEGRCRRKPPTSSSLAKLYLSCPGIPGFDLTSCLTRTRFTASPRLALDCRLWRDGNAVGSLPVLMTSKGRR